MNTATTHDIQTDRRRHVRVAARGVASHLQTMDASMPGLSVENLSVGGMFVRSAAALAVGTRVMVQLVRPGLKKAIPTLGCVVSVIHPAEAQKHGSVAGMGIRLDPVELDAARRLRELVDDLAATPTRSSSPPPAAPPEPAEPAPITRPSAPPPPVAQAAAIELAPSRPVDTSSEDIEARSRLVEQLEEEVMALRRELLRRNRTIGDLAARLAAYEPEGAGEARRLSRRPVTGRFIRLSDPRAE